PGLPGLGHKPLGVENPNAIAGLGEYKQPLATGIDICLGLNADARYGAVDFILGILREKGAKPIQVSDEVFDITSVYGAFTKGPHRLSLAYVKQVAGINCTGGVCRYEPAFSGIRSTFTTSF
ncbi:MAG: hypothetical protein EBZ77_06175, partial [Chitinophagia bacterium]|nr:hypothetical protein [Chitinophagia bacterium]